MTDVPGIQVGDQAFLEGAGSMNESLFRLDGRAAMVVGAGHGIGRAIALAFGAVGATVGCIDHADEPAKAVAREIAGAGGKAEAITCDVTRETDVDVAVARFVSACGPPTILVNGAASNDPLGTILELSPVEWTRTLTVNLTGAYLMSRAVLPHMIAAGGGSIIHIASQMGRVGAAGRPAYCATKGALIQLAKVMAVDHAPQNVRVNTLSPGAVETRRMLLRYGDMETARQTSGPLHLLKRLGQPDEIAAAAIFLASDASSFVTGADLLVDGGYTAI
jgi:NAD(P)-dependent dehydrogenase (short-subunit alcohol dehydrogenase family)